MNRATKGARFFVVSAGLCLTLAGATALAQINPPARPETTMDAVARAEILRGDPGAPGSFRRAEVLAAAHRAVALGEIDPRALTFPLDLEPTLPTFYPFPSIAGGTEAAGAACAVIDPFSTYTLIDFTTPTPTNPIDGQTNVFNKTVTSQNWVGVATNAVMMNNISSITGNFPTTPPAGGEPYLALARRTGKDPRTTASLIAMTYPVFTIIPGPTPGEHARASMDWYLQDAGTSQVSSMLSTAQGLFVDRVFFGGTNLPSPFSIFSNNATPFVLDTFVILGPIPGNPAIGQFFEAARNPSVLPFPVQEWFSLMSIMVQDSNGNFGSGVFIKTPETIANGVLDPRMAAGDIIPIDKDPAGWLNIYPGVVDDPTTTAMIEGIGLANDIFFDFASTAGAFGFAPLLAATHIDAIQLGSGQDPSPTTVANFQPEDAFIANIQAAGQQPPLLCDVNGDCVVDGADLAIILNDFGNGAIANGGNGIPIGDPRADTNGDGVVNGADIACTLNGFLSICTCP